MKNTAKGLHSCFRFSQSFLVISLLFFSHSSLAFRLSPMTVRLAPQGPASTQNLTLENNSSEKTSVKIEIFRRFVDREGKESLTPTDELSVYPQQISLQPTEHRFLRVSWNGVRQPDREFNYRLVVTELAAEKMKTQKKNSPVQPGPDAPVILLQYVASVYITPADALPELIVQSVHVLPENKFELLIRNDGKAHSVLRGLDLSYNARELKTGLLEGENVLAQSERRFVLELPAALRVLGESELNSSSLQVKVRAE